MTYEPEGDNPYLRYPFTQLLDIAHMTERHLEQLPPTNPPSAQHQKYEATLALIYQAIAKYKKGSLPA